MLFIATPYINLFDSVILLIVNQIGCFSIDRGDGKITNPHFFLEDEIRSQPVTQIPWSALSRVIIQ